MNYVLKGNVTFCFPPASGSFEWVWILLGEDLWYPGSGKTCIHIYFCMWTRAKWRNICDSGLQRLIHWYGQMINILLWTGVSFCDISAIIWHALKSRWQIHTKVFIFCSLKLEKLIEKNYYLHKSAQEAYKSYVRAYDSHSLKAIYSVNTLNLPMVALSFGFKVPPYVDLSILFRRQQPRHTFTNVVQSVASPWFIYLWSWLLKTYPIYLWLK